MQLRIESVNGSPINDYRTTDSDLIQLRILDPSGHRFPGADSNWRFLDDNDIQIHHALGTVVSKWLRVRLRDTARGRG